MLFDCASFYICHFVVTHCQKHVRLDIRKRHIALRTWKCSKTKMFSYTLGTTDLISSSASSIHADLVCRFIGISARAHIFFLLALNIICHVLASLCCFIFIPHGAFVRPLQQPVARAQKTVIVSLVIYSWVKEMTTRVAQHFSIV